MNNEVVEQIERLVKDVMNNSLHTSMPGKILSVDEASGLMSVQPTGSFYCGKIEMDYPVVPGIPMCVTANSNGIAACSPVKAGDDVLLICAEQSLSAFITETSEAQSNEKFELTNCIAIPGIQRSMPEAQKEANEKDAIVFTNGEDVKALITKEEIEVTNGDNIKILISGDLVKVTNGDVEFSISGENISLKGDTKLEGNLEIEGDVSVEGETIFKGKVTIKGDLEVEGNITATGNINGANSEG
ncbi:MAG: hypothetical protein NC347_07115 [Clostridium sp.]|nr:hypothetical protein [Clostridium sp.]